MSGIWLFAFLRYVHLQSSSSIFFSLSPIFPLRCNNIYILFTDVCLLVVIQGTFFVSSPVPQPVSGFNLVMYSACALHQLPGLRTIHIRRFDSSKASSKEESDANSFVTEARRQNEYIKHEEQLGKGRAKLRSRKWVLKRKKRQVNQKKEYVTAKIEIEKKEYTRKSIQERREERVYNLGRRLTPTNSQWLTDHRPLTQWRTYNSK